MRSADTKVSLATDIKKRGAVEQLLTTWFVLESDEDPQDVVLRELMRQLSAMGVCIKSDDQTCLISHYHDPDGQVVRTKKAMLKAGFARVIPLMENPGSEDGGNE